MCYLNFLLLVLVFYFLQNKLDPIDKMKVVGSVGRPLVAKP